MPITIDKSIWDKLDKFFATKTIQDVDRSSFLHCGLKDTINNINISLVFIKNYDISESDNYNYVSIAPEGAVFTFPSHWTCIPKELAMPYFKYVITKFYEEEVSKWKSNIGSGSSSSNTNGLNSNCGCNPQCGII